MGLFIVSPGYYSALQSVKMAEMIAQSGPAARRGFILALALALLALLSALLMPIPGILQTAIYLAIAWGIRHGDWWAALCAACMLLLNVVVAAVGGGTAQAISLTIGVLFALICGYVFLHAAIELKGSKGASSLAWPWVAILCGMAVFSLCFQGYSMNSASMQKTLLVGDLMLVDRISGHLGKRPARDELIMFHYPLNRQELYVKRVIGVPGDRLRIADKQLYRNGTALSEPYASHVTSYVDRYRDNFPSEPETKLPDRAIAMLRDNVRNGEVVVPPGQYFVMGDNRDDSLDSRYWGFVPANDIVGRPILIYGSNDLENGSAVKGVATVFNTRWERLLKWL